MNTSKKLTSFAETHSKWCLMCDNDAMTGCELCKRCVRLAAGESFVEEFILGGQRGSIRDGEFTLSCSQASGEIESQ